jgi:hypothetical protein
MLMIKITGIGDVIQGVTKIEKSLRPSLKKLPTFSDQVESMSKKRRLR